MPQLHTAQLEWPATGLHILQPAHGIATMKGTAQHVWYIVCFLKAKWRWQGLAAAVHTLNVVKKNSPGESCKNLTPCSATGASRNTTRSLEKQKQVRMAPPAASAAINSRSLSSSRWSQIGISELLSSEASGYRKDCNAVFSASL